jgi:sugar (pentulose or hexulose) kinase
MNLLGEVGNFTYDDFYKHAAACDPDCGGLLTYNYYSGEPVTGTSDGRPLFMRKPDAVYTLQNLCGSLLYSAIATLRIGMDVLYGENVKIDRIGCHGGFFKNPYGLQVTADALNVPVSLSESAGEGGAWGIALLADYTAHGSIPLHEYLAQVFNQPQVTKKPAEAGVKRFNKYLQSYKQGLDVQRKAVEIW